jgi:YHS domain-containing protein
VRPTKFDEENDMKQQLKLMLAGAVIVGVSACAPLVVQSPGGQISPVNAVAQGDDKHLMLFGHDVVSYFTENKHRLGSEAYKSKVGEVTFRFSSAENKAVFDKEPNKYVPQYGGYCANGLVYSIPWGGNADNFKIIDGKLYIFGGQGSLDAFMLDVKGNTELADKYWKTEVAGSNAFIHRTKRTTLARVAHYKSGPELAAAVANAKAK